MDTDYTGDPAATFAAIVAARVIDCGYGTIPQVALFSACSNITDANPVRPDQVRAMAGATFYSKLERSS